MPSSPSEMNQIGACSEDVFTPLLMFRCHQYHTPSIDVFGLCLASKVNKVSSETGFARSFMPLTATFLSTAEEVSPDHRIAGSEASVTARTAAIAAIPSSFLSR